MDLGAEFAEELWDLFELDTSSDLDAKYDATVALGELASTRILAEYLKKCGFNACWWDVRNTIKTDARHRVARASENDMQVNGIEMMSLFNYHSIIVTQGFIGSSPLWLYYYAWKRGV